MSASAASFAGDAEINGAFEDALKLQAFIFRIAVALIVICHFSVFFLENRKDRLAHVSTVEHDKIPGLHETDGRRIVCGVERAGQDLCRYGFRQKLGANIPAFVDGTVQAVAFVITERAVVICHRYCVP